MTRKIIGFDISYDKNPETIQKIIDSSPKSKQYYSDGYNGYFGSFHFLLLNDNILY